MASKKHCAWLPHYPADFGIETSQFTAEEISAYVLLRDYFWANDGELPQDELRLARIARTSDEEWPTVRAALLTCFKIEDGVWTHPGLNEQLREQEARYQRRSNAGKKGNDAKRAQRERNASTKRNQPDSESEPDSSNEETPHSPPAGGGYSNDFKTFWEAYPSKVGKDGAYRTFKTATKKGATLQGLLDGIARYKRSNPADLKFCNPDKWLRQGRWKDETASSKSAKPLKPNPRKDWETRLAIYKPGGVWLHDWGPRPEEAGCKVPPDLLTMWKEKKDLELPNFLRRTPST